MPRILVASFFSGHGVQCDMIYGPFYSVGRFGCSCGPFWILLWAVLDISKIYGPFWSGPFWFMGRFGIDPFKTLNNNINHYYNHVD